MGVWDTPPTKEEIGTVVPAPRRRKGDAPKASVWDVPPTEEEVAAVAPAQAEETRPAPSRMEAAGKGALQGATLGFWDEIKGAADALGITKADLATALLAGPLAAPSLLGLKAAATTADKGAGKVVDDYRAARDTERAETEAIEKARPRAFLAGQIGGGVASAIVPGGAAGALGKAVAAGAKYGAAAGLGGSKADLTKGDVEGAALDTAIGAGTGAIGGALGHGAAKGVEGVRGFANRLSKDKMIEGLTKYFHNITTRGGSPESQKAVAGKLMDEAVKAAGDARTVPQKFLGTADEVLNEARSEFSDKLPAVAEELVNRAERVSTGKGVTLRDLHNEFKFWTDKAAALKPVKGGGGDPAGYRIAVKAKEALRGELADAHPSLGEAAEMYAAGRAKYAAGADADDLQTILLKARDPLSKGGATLSPRRIAMLYTGTKKAQVDAHLKTQGPGAKEAWEMGVEAAREIAKKGDTWLPKLARDALPPKAINAFNNLMTSHNVMKVFTDPEMAREYRRLAFGVESLKAREIAGIVSRLTARLADEAGYPDEAVAHSVAAARERFGEPGLQVAGNKLAQ